VTEPRLRPPEERLAKPRGEALVADFAAGSGSASSVQPKTLDGVFCFGGDEEEHLAKAAAARSAEDPRAQVLGMLKLADIHAQAGRLQEAAKEVEDAQSLIRELRFEEGRACTLVLIAKIYAKQGKLSTADQLDEALDLAVEAQEKFQKFGAKKCEAAALLALAAVRHVAGNYEDGNLAAKESQVLLEEMGEASAVAEVYHVVADGYLLRDDTKRASTWVSKAKEIQQDLGNRRKVAECLHRLGEIDIRANDRAKAVATLFEAQSLFKELGDLKGEMVVLKTLQDFHLKKGRLAEAIGIGQEMVTTCHDIGDTRGEGNALMSLAELLLEKEEIDLCEKVLRTAHQVFTKCRDADGVGKVMTLGAHLKNAALKRQIKESITANADQAHYPVHHMVELGLQQRTAEAFAALKKGL